jgi:diguanylate cyclase (GGDEF)-like protein
VTGAAGSDDVGAVVEILVVDDDEGARSTLLDILDLAGLSASAVASAGEALAAWDVATPQLAIVDYRLPDSTGLELAARLKDADPDLPVIVLTGNASLETAVAAVGQVDEYLTKPVAAARLLRSVRAGLEQRRLRCENRDLLGRLREANLTLEARVRVRTEELHADRERLAEAQRIARIGSWEWDIEAQRLTCSPELRRLYGVDAGREVTSYEDLFTHLPVDDGARITDVVLEAVARGEPFTVETCVTVPGDQPRWLQVQGRIQVDEDGRAVHLVGTAQDVTERKLSEKALAHQALHDALTGLPNRVLLVDRLEQALVGAARIDGKVAVLFLDIDRFKLINDSRGHAAGDELILGVAERLRATVRPADTVARFGGDEFVVVCQDIGTLSEAIAVADRIAAALREPFRVTGEEMFLTVSAGIAISGPDPSSEALLRNADAAMYRAKEQGRARCEFFDETMQTEATARLELQTALNWAVQRDEMRVFYQPLVDVASGHAVGVEALVRWDHPERGIVSPESFILLAEETGLIVPIGSSVLHEAARDHRQWREVFPQGLFTISVNLSAHQLRHPGLLDQVRAVLDQYGLQASSLCLELTETALLQDLDRHIGVLMALRSLGVRLALDDFGTGYSSLTYLKQFPVDIVKIDRSFVNGLGVDHYDSTIVRGLVELAHALQLVVVAEGIERPEQWEQLRRLGCDLAQGYLFSPPVPAGVLLDRLAVRPRWDDGTCGRRPDLDGRPVVPAAIGSV